MNRQPIYKKLAATALLVTLWSLPLAVFAQTRVDLPKNKYKIQDDVKLGNQAASEIDKRFPILNDADATRYIERVGARLASSIPSQFRQPAFIYRFKLVNASDINAFALPGGPMYVNRGMIEAAKNEGEMAGVMAHEISHVALRHATAQATKQSGLGNQLGMIGLILGGAIFGGEAGAQGGALLATAWQTKYSRAYETQADILGAQIMADAGYDPRDLANMFKTIAGERTGGGAPEWLSSHPDPGNRFAKINNEASLLRISPNPIKVTRDFTRIQTRLRAMPRARTMAEIEKGVKNGQGTTPNPTANGRYSSEVEYPSTRVKAYTDINAVRLNIPTNWIEFSGTNEAQFAPEGAYGDQGITHGVMVGLYNGENNDLARDTNAYITNVLSGNNYLSRRGGYTNAYINGRRAAASTLSGRSPVTNRTEIVTVYTTLLSTGELLYIVTVVPDGESASYANAFRNIINSIRLNDQ